MCLSSLALRAAITVDHSEPVSLRARRHQINRGDERKEQFQTSARRPQHSYGVVKNELHGTARGEVLGD